jgi:hypothetical protein
LRGEPGPRRFSRGLEWELLASSAEETLSGDGALAVWSEATELNALGCPGNCLLCPNAIGIFLLKRFLYFAQHCVIVFALVLAYGLPVNRFRRCLTVGIFLKDFIIKLFRVRPFLLHKGDARQSQQQLRGKFVFWQITFNAVPLFAVFVQHQGGWCPDGIKAVEPGRIFFDVDSNRYEFLVDKGCELRVGV